MLSFLYSNNSDQFELLLPRKMMSNGMTLLEKISGDRHLNYPHFIGSGWQEANEKRKEIFPSNLNKSSPVEYNLQDVFWEQP